MLIIVIIFTCWILCLIAIYVCFNFICVELLINFLIFKFD